MSLKLAPAVAASAPYEVVVVNAIVILFVASDVEGLFKVLSAPDSERPLII
jgi:hypothetical protein